MTGYSDVRRVWISNNPVIVELTPESLKAARAILNWDRIDLAKAIARYGNLKDMRDHIGEFEDCGVTLLPYHEAAIKHVLLNKVEFVIDDDEVGVCRSPHIRAEPASYDIASWYTRRPKL